MAGHGERLKAAREKAGMTQSELGKLVGVTGVAIMRYEKELREPTLEQLRHMADALNADIVYLISGQTSAEVEQGILIDAEVESRTELKKLQTRMKDRSYEERISLNTATIHLLKLLENFSPVGHRKAVERVEELTEIPRYRRQDGTDHPTPPQDTPAPQTAPETAEKGE